MKSIPSLKTGKITSIEKREGEQPLEKTLREILLSLESRSPYCINEYFATDFAEDYEKLERNKENRPILEFLNDSFTDIDVDYDGSSAMDAKIIDTLKKAISMCRE